MARNMARSSAFGRLQHRELGLQLGDAAAQARELGGRVVHGFGLGHAAHSRIPLTRLARAAPSVRDAFRRSARGGAGAPPRRPRQPCAVAEELRVDRRALLEDLAGVVDGLRASRRG